MSARTAQLTGHEHATMVPPRRYPLRVRATIMIGSAAGLWGLLGLAGWVIYRIV